MLQCNVIAGQDTQPDFEQLCCYERALYDGLSRPYCSGFMVQGKKLVRAFIPRRMRNWVRSPAKSIEWLWAELKYLVHLNQELEVRPGWIVHSHPVAFGFAYWAQASDQEQIDEFDGFIASCRPDMVFFDIGAHFGLFSLAALHYGGTSASAIAVDPSGIATRILRIQAHLNDVSQRLRIIQAAVSDSVGSKEMIDVGVISHGFWIAADKGHSSSDVTQTHSTTLDDLAEEVGVLPTHVKIDVEGSEANVLRGGSHVLSQIQAPILFVEIHNQIIREHDGDPADTLSLLKQFNYKTFSVDGSPIDDSAILSKPIIRVVARKG